MERTIMAVLGIYLLWAGSVCAHVWQDDSERDELGEDWTPVAWDAPNPPDWKVEDGVLKARWPNWNAQMLFLDEYPLQDYTMQVKCRIDEVWEPSDYAGGGFVFRSTGPDGITPFCALGLCIWCAKFFLAHGNAIWRDAAREPRNHTVGEWYTLKLIVVGKTFLGYADDELAHEAHNRPRTCTRA